MPISRKQVRLGCSPDEYEIYCSSLRLKLPRLPLRVLHLCIARARELIRKRGPAKRKPSKPRALPRMRDLLSGALSRFEERLKVLAQEQRRHGAGAPK